jgi:TRAP transporter TAXI family solute receptor
MVTSNYQKEEKMINKKWFGICLIVVLALAFALGPVHAAQRRFLSIASGWVTGAYYPFAGAVSRVAWKHLKEQNIKVTAESSGASVANAKLIGTGDTDFALLQNDIASYAYYGKKGMFDEPIKNLLGCMTLYPETIQLVARKEAKIKSVKDLKGKRVSIGPLGSGTTENAKQILAAWGLALDDIQAQQLKTQQAADYMVDGRLDAYFATTAVGAAVIIDTAVRVPAVIVPVKGRNAKKLMKEYAFYAKDTVPAGIYKGIDKPVETVAVMAMMVARADLEDDIVYAIVKATYEDLEQVKKAHAKFKGIDVKKSQMGMSVPLHPGAMRYFKEVGVVK